MADSNITKHALAQALKELVKTKPIEKISIGNICDACGLNRKSFYYHFQDKYELINWIYNTEFVQPALKKKYEHEWELLEDVCRYFYENRDFYKKTFCIEGQNSFSEYFFSFACDLISKLIVDSFPEEPSVTPYAEFFTDAFVNAIKKWLSAKDCIPPHEFCLFLQKAILGASHHAYTHYGIHNESVTS